MKMLILSGRSGSGKTTALQALEDQGFYCVDNLPVGLLPSLAEQLRDGDSNNRNIAVGIDARNVPAQLLDFDRILEQLKQQLDNIEIVFLDADHDTLLKRFSATRRRHPLSGGELTLADAIKKEAVLLANLRLRAQLVIDTSNLDVHTLRNQIRERVAKRSAPLSLQLESFGFKYGLPQDADLVFDVRVLANPHWINKLRPLTGQDPAIIEYMQQHPASLEMLDDISGFINRWLPAYQNNDRTYMTIAIGCTGGRHRSVFIVEQLAKQLAGHDISLQVRHRDLGHL